MLDFLEDLVAFVLGWIFIVGFFALFLFTIRVFAWLVDVILLWGW